MLKKPATIRNQIKQLFSLRYFQIVWPLPLLFVLLTLLLPVWQLMPWIKESVGIPLHYNTHFGVDLFGQWWKIYLFAVFGFSVWIINLIASIVFFKRDEVLSYLFAGTTLLVEIFLFIAMIFVVLLNLTYA